MEDGRTGLHISAESGNVAVLRQLLENGADPQLEDKVGLNFKIYVLPPSNGKKNIIGYFGKVLQLIYGPK